MLKGISPIISPELLKVLMEMGHGDEIVISDGNFPGASTAKNLVRLDGHGVVEVLDAILKLMPLDSYVDCPVVLMQTQPQDNYIPEIWGEIKKTVEKYEPEKKIENIDRFDYYDRAKQAYAVVQTGETAVYANVLLKKGVCK